MALARGSLTALRTTLRSCRVGVPVRPARPGRHCSARAMASAAGGGSTYWILDYKYVPDILERRGPYREGHLAGAKAKLDAGKLVMAGAAGDPVEGAVFIFKNVSKEEIDAFVRDDPYVQNGLVPSHSIKPYAVVVGNP